MQDLDPSQPFIGDDGLEYEDLAQYVLGRPVDCRRNDIIRSLHDRPAVKSGSQTWKSVVACQYQHQNRGGFLCAAPNGGVNQIRVPQRFERFLDPQPSSPGGPEGAGRPGAVQAPADPVHAAD